MEDLKQIQEFFSKPLEESKQLDIVDFAKVVQAVTKTGHPATVLLVPKWNEIEIITGMNAPDDMLFDLSNAVDSLGYGRNDIIIAADSSNLSRREYSDIRRVNGGHKDYFEESVNENEDPIIVKYFKRGDNHFQILVKYERPTGFTTALGSRTALGSQIDQNEAAAKERVKAIVNKLKAEFNLDNIEVSKGQVAGRYYIDAFSDSFREMDVNDLEEFYALNEATKEEENKFHKKLDKLVHDTFGKRKGEMEEYNTGIYFNPDKATQRNKAKKASKSAMDKVRDVIKKALTGDYQPTITEKDISVDDNTEFKLNLKHLLDKHVVKENEEQQVKVGNYQTKHFDICPGAVAVYKDIEVEDMDLAERAAKLQDALFAMEKEALENGASDLDVEAAQILADQIMAMAKMMGLEKEHSYVQGHVEKIKGTLSEGLADYEEKDADYDKLYSDYAYKAVKEVVEEKGFSKYLKSKDNPKGETDGLDIKTMNKILMKVVKEVEETIQLGKQLDEKKLCPKGEAYRKRRMAAGEKSSAYLSGRAVKVCKGQMSGKKKK